MTDNTQSGSDINVTSKDTPTEVEADKLKGTQAEQSAKIAHTTQAELDVIFDKMGYPKNTDFREDAIRLITDWHNKQIEEVLDRLEARLAEEASGIRQIKTDYAYGFTAANDQTNEAIEAERNKLKESK